MASRSRGLVVSRSRSPVVSSSYWRASQSFSVILSLSQSFPANRAPQPIARLSQSRASVNRASQSIARPSQSRAPANRAPQPIVRPSQSRTSANRAPPSRSLKKTPASRSPLLTSHPSPLTPRCAACTLRHIAFLLHFFYFFLRE